MYVFKNYFINYILNMKHYFESYMKCIYIICINMWHYHALIFDEKQMKVNDLVIVFEKWNFCISRILKFVTCLVGTYVICDIWYVEPFICVWPSFGNGICDMIWFDIYFSYVEKCLLDIFGTNESSPCVSTY